MDFGVVIFATDYTITPAELAVAAEERGFESLWLPEHSHIPSSRRSPFPYGSELPKRYYDTLDPFVALAAAASVTKTIKLATGICLVVQRDPIQNAKEVATLDQISNGRVLFGIGAGWNAEEMEDHGTVFETRFKLMRERIEAMKEIWVSKQPEYHGEFVDFDKMMTWPKPVQKPHPPVIVGGGFPYGARRAVRYGDGWMPVGSRRDDVAAQATAFREMAAEAGRDPASLSLTAYGARFEAEDVERYREAGFDRVLFLLPSEGRDKIMPMLDTLTPLIS